MRSPAAVIWLRSSDCGPPPRPSIGDNPTDNSGEDQVMPAAKDRPPRPNISKQGARTVRRLGPAVLACLGCLGLAGPAVSEAVKEYGKPGEPIELVVGYQPYYTES